MVAVAISSICLRERLSIMWPLWALCTARIPHSQSYCLYSAHTDDILCLSLHPAQDLVATGQVKKISIDTNLFILSAYCL